MRSTLGALAALSLLASSNAHSWVEMMNVIAPNGTFTGAPGFARGNCQRGPGVDPDKCMVHLLPPNGRAEANKILDTDPMCMPSQQTQTQTKDSPRLQAAPGSMIALRYQENGHVSLPQNNPGKAPNRGTVYIYGTTQPDPNEKFLSVHNVWNADGTGGDKRGKLLATQNYDDGQCYQLNGGAISTTRQKQFAHDATQPMGQDLWCQNDLALPSDAPAGKPYTLYWVWDWATAPNVPGSGQPSGKNETYTSCLDARAPLPRNLRVDITGSSSTSAKDSTPIKFVDGQSLNNAAVPSYMNALAKGNANLASTPQGSSAAAPQAPASSPVQSPNAPAATPSSQAAPAPAPPPPSSQAASPAAPPAAPPAGAQPAPNTVSVPQVSAPEPPTSAAAGPATPPQPTTSAAAGPATVTVTASAQAMTVTVSAGAPQNTAVSAGFSGTASALPAVTPAANFQCNTCKMRRQTKILGTVSKAR